MVDEEIARQRTSRLCFIHRLPTETLEAIFVQRAHDYFREATGRPIPTAPSWVNVSYVCRHWRNIALNCPTLWTYLFVTSPRWTEELLARSKQASLKLAADLRDWYEKHQGSRSVEEVMNHSERIQDLRLHIPMGDYDVLSKLPSTLRAPRLEHLELSASLYHRVWYSGLVDGDTPALRTLRLTGHTASWYSLKLTGLTTLGLYNISPRFQLGTKDFLATLCCMQDLKYLYLDQALTTSTGFLSSPEFHTLQKINLPHLSHLFIIAPLSTVIAFLSCINIPLRTEVRLGPDYGFGEDPSVLDNYDSLYSLLAQRYGMSQDQAFSNLMVRSLVIKYSDSELYECAKLNFRTSERDCDSCPSVPCTEWDCAIRLQILLAFRQSTSDRNRLISRICCSISLSNVRTLHVFDPPFSLTFWTDVLGQLPYLQRIKLSHGTMPDLASVLSLTPRSSTENQDGQADRDQSQIFAPALEELELHDISFSTAQQSGMCAFKADDIRALCDALSTRKLPRGRLTMSRCIGHSEVYLPLETFDLEGCWGDGRFSVVSYRRIG